jgi:hypothetical protein
MKKLINEAFRLQQMAGIEPINSIVEGNDVLGQPSNDHEASMAKAELKSLIKNATSLHDHIEHHTELPGWMSAYITLASDYINSVTESIEGYEEEGQGEVQVSIMEKDEE